MQKKEEAKDKKTEAPTRILIHIQPTSNSTPIPVQKKEEKAAKPKEVKKTPTKKKVRSVCGLVVVERRGAGGWGVVGRWVMAVKGGGLVGRVAGLREGV